MLETTHNTQRTTHNYSRAPVLNLTPRDFNRLRSYCRLCGGVMCTCEQSGQLTSLLRYCGRSVIYLRLPALYAFFLSGLVKLKPLIEASAGFFSQIFYYYFLFFLSLVMRFQSSTPSWVLQSYLSTSVIFYHPVMNIAAIHAVLVHRLSLMTCTAYLPWLVPIYSSYWQSGDPW